MPIGNHHMSPHGFWTIPPTNLKLSGLILGSVGKIAITLAGFAVIASYRSIAYNTTYINFKGKTMSLGPMTILNHEPLSVEEIDKLKQAQAIKKRLAKEN